MSLGESGAGGLRSESETALERLKRALRRGNDFALYVVVAQDAARWELLRRLQGWSGIGGVPELYFFPEGREVVGALEAFVAKYDMGHPLTGAVIGDSRSLFEERGGEPIAALNLARDNLGFLIHGPLILVVSKEHAAQLPARAPDLFDVRAMSVELEVEVLPPAGREILERRYEYGKAARPVSELRREAAQLRAMGAGGEEAPPAGALSDAWIKLGQWFLDAGEMADALDAAKEAKAWAELFGYERGVALAQGLKAAVLYRLGQLDEALRIRREEELPVYERLGDIREKAFTLSQIADILQARGQLDAALRIYHDEQLPVYERLGDIRSKVITMGKIADILFTRGQFDAALRIYREEELPVFERLGDSREKAIIMSKIADILFAKGQLDEALRIYREDVLPVHERLGDSRFLLIGRANLAIALAQRGHPSDQPEIARLLTLALADAERLGIPEAQEIRELQAKLLTRSPRP